MANYTHEYEDGDYVFKNGPLVLSPERIIAMLNENDILAEQLNQLSNELVGCREGKFQEMMQRAIHLKLKAQNVEIDNNFREITDKIDELQGLVEDIKSDA